MKRYTIYQGDRLITTIETNDPSIDNPLFHDEAYTVIVEDIEQEAITQVQLDAHLQHMENIQENRTTFIEATTTEEDAAKNI